MKYIIILSILFTVFWGCNYKKGQNNIPLAEHTRPDFMRSEWKNLNGEWQFRFDKNDSGTQQKWFVDTTQFEQKIKVPFTWGSKLSGVKDEADIGWYKTEIEIPDEWQGDSFYLIIGACDWHTTVWLNGEKLGEHKGGYTPFEFKFPDHVEKGKSYSLVIRVDDSPYDFKLVGKQGYGRAAGIWQTIYLEARSHTHMQSVHFTPDIDSRRLFVKLLLNRQISQGLKLDLKINDQAFKDSTLTILIPSAKKEFQFIVPMKNPHLWSLDDPYLYEVDAVLYSDDQILDKVSSYFGMRKISVTAFPGKGYPYIALNNKPVYLQMALDQAYHPDGYYTFPGDEFIKNEILRAKEIGLNGLRVHIKVPIPRKLYWADKLGVLIMADVPNNSGPPSDESKQEIEYALKGIVNRDYNHPSIFSWVNFNETWGLRNEKGVYTKETQEWVKSIYLFTKHLDPSRLVEDNSTNNLDHTYTDINSWHAYLPGHRWDKVLDLYSQKSFRGSPFNFVEGYTQINQPLLNSECGNVWGYETDQGGYATGDVDFSWDYHQMINAFRSHPKFCGWIYTQHHDVINEWNGYYKYDRSKKITGLSDIFDGMTLKDLHSTVFVRVGEKLSQNAQAGSVVKVPLYASYLTDKNYGKKLTYYAEYFGWNSLGEKTEYLSSNYPVPYSKWMSKSVGSAEIVMPQETSVNIFGIRVESADKKVLTRNFTVFNVQNKAEKRDEFIETDSTTKRIIRIDPAKFSSAKWSQKQWHVLDGLKVNGAGYGYFEYKIPWPQNLDIDSVKHTEFLIELSAKKMHAKDFEQKEDIVGDYMQGKGTHQSGLSPNAYPMTDEQKFPSRVNISIGGVLLKEVMLEDDPADHRGLLSWHNQKRNESVLLNAASFRDFKGGELHEAGSYGYLVRVNLPADVLRKASLDQEITIRMQVDESSSGGLAVYGNKFGRYPLDPTLIFTMSAE
jgi:hypothetical protein